MDIQDSSFRYYKKGASVNVVSDAKASDGFAASMPSTHTDWAIQADLPSMPTNPGYSGKWRVYASVRVVKQGAGQGTAFAAGVYDMVTKKNAVAVYPKLRDCGDEYKFHLVGSVIPGSKYIYIAPTKNPENVKEILVDRIMLVRDN